jgi:PAS domain S-box-containing protein
MNLSQGRWIALALAPGQPGIEKATIADHPRVKILRMKEPHVNLTRTTTRLASVIAGLIAFPLPVAFFTLVLQYNLAAMNDEAKIRADNISALISANPRSWQLDEAGLQALIKDLNDTGLPESRRVVDVHGGMIVQSFDSNEYRGPVEASEALDPRNAWTLARRTDLKDADKVVGHFEIMRDVRPLLLETALVSLLGLLLGALVLIVLRVYPLRALKLTLATLAAEKERAEVTLQAIGDAVVTVDGRGTVQSFNPAAEKIFAYAAAEVVGQSIKMLLPASFAKDFEAYLRRYPDTGQAYLSGIEREVTAQRSDGEVFPVDLRISEFFLNGRRQLIGSMRDLTERKRAQVEILHLNATLEARVDERTAQLKFANEQLRIVTQRLRQLAAHQEGVREAERTRIAHELHDELGGLLTSARFDIGRLAKLPGVGSPCVEKLRDTVDAAIASTRTIISDLRPPVIDHLGVWRAIDWYARELANRRGLRRQVVIEPELEEVTPPHDVSICLYRIAQEALNNVVKHAEATSITVNVRRLPAGLVEVEVVDDGKGLSAEDLAKVGRWGVMGMRERVHSHGGELTLTSTPGLGTTLRATLRID